AGPVRVDDSVRRHGVHGPHWALPATSGRRLAFFPENSASIRVPWPRRAREPRLKCSSCRAGDRFRSAFGGTGPVQSVLVIRDSGGRCAELLVRRASPEHPWTRAGRLARRPFRSGRDRTQRPKYSNVSSLRTKPEAVSTNGPPVRVAAWAVRHVPVDDDDAGQRLDNFLVRLCRDVPKSHLYRLIRSGQLRVNGKRQAADYRLQAGDSIRVPPIRLEPAAEATGVGAASGAATERIRRTRAGLAQRLPVLFEDDWLLAIDKPASVAVHGGSGVSSGVIEQLRAARPQARFLELVHRLDRETSGVLLVARKRAALVALHAQLRER